MNRDHLSRRQFSVALAVGLGTTLAGCASDDDETDDDENGDDETGDDENGDDETGDDENGDDENGDADVEDDGPGSVIVHLETGDGDPVSEGVEVTVDLEDDPLSYTYSQEIEDGEVTIDVEDEGEYTVTAESTDDEFDPVEEDVSVGEDDEEVTLVLEGATADGDREDEEGDE